MPHCQVFTASEIASMRRAGGILADCLAMLRPLVQPGVTTGELDRRAEEFIRAQGGTPAFKGYHNYPATLCTSVNEECVHGLPGARVLGGGDIVSLDCGVIVDDLYTDACITVSVGMLSVEASHLLAVTERALEEGMKVVRAGAKVGDISATIQGVVEAAGCTCVDALTGHGVGRSLHQYPDVPNVGRRGTGATLPLHTCIAIEPIVCLGKARIHQSNDGWTISTADKSLTAHFEHTVLVTEGGCEVLA